jgi:hypothetical protein
MPVQVISGNTTPEFEVSYRSTKSFDVATEVVFWLHVSATILDIK